MNEKTKRSQKEVVVAMDARTARRFRKAAGALSELATALIKATDEGALDSRQK